jgi:hypothetical protein
VVEHHGAHPECRPRPHRGRQLLAAQAPSPRPALRLLRRGPLWTHRRMGSTTSSFGSASHSSGSPSLVPVKPEPISPLRSTPRTRSHGVLHALRDVERLYIYVFIRF